MPLPLYDFLHILYLLQPPAVQAQTPPPPVLPLPSLALRSPSGAYSGTYSPCLPPRPPSYPHLPQTNLVSLVQQVHYALYSPS